MRRRETGISRRSMLLAGAAGAGSVALAACGGQPGAEPQATSSKVTGTLSFWHWGITYIDGFDKLTAEFGEKQNGAKVTRDMPDGVDDKIKVTIAAGSGAPDVYLMRGPNHKQWSHDGLTVDLTQFSSKDKTA
jgi:ABC-type glycerol-3-phosphate transport system substrate-binding protein